MHPAGSEPLPGAASPETDAPAPTDAEAGASTRAAARAPATTRRRLLQLTICLAVLAGLYALVRLSGVSDSPSVAALRTAVQQAGPWGPAVYVLGYCGAYLAGTPGLPFVALGVAAWGQLEGGVLAFAASLLAVTCNFWVARLIGSRLAGDRDLSRIPWQFARNQLRRLDEGPVRTIAVVRAILILPPVLDYLLGLTAVSYRRFLLGSTLGLIPPLVATILLIETLVRWLGL